MIEKSLLRRVIAPAGDRNERNATVKILLFY